MQSLSLSLFLLNLLQSVASPPVATDGTASPATSRHTCPDNQCPDCSICECNLLKLRGHKSLSLSKISVIVLTSSFNCVAPCVVLEGRLCEHGMCRQRESESSRAREFDCMQVSCIPIHPSLAAIQFSTVALSSLSRSLSLSILQINTEKSVTLFTVLGP